MAEGPPPDPQGAPAPGAPRPARPKPSPPRPKPSPPPGMRGAGSREAGPPPDRGLGATARPGASCRDRPRPSPGVPGHRNAAGETPPKAIFAGLPRDRAVGPLGAAVRTDGQVLKPPVGFQCGADANALILLRRVAFVDDTGIASPAERALLSWARDHRLGQEPVLLAAVARRREAAVRRRVARGRLRGREVVHRRVVVRPQWRTVTGIGDRHNPHEIGIALHGTYGWPVLPGSTIRGAVRAHAGAEARALAEPERTRGLARLETLLGPSPASAEHRIGQVDFLDALPAGSPVRVTVDGVTPHVQPYHGGKEPPAEWHNPVPSAFLTISGGSFAIDFLGPPDAADQVAAWCVAACDTGGIGAKTAAGYGYLEENP